MNTDVDLELAQSEELQKIARAVLAEAEFYATPEYPQDTHWKGTPPSDKQLKLIRMRRGGPEFNYKIPEALYKAMMIVLTGKPSSKAITSRGQAVAYLDAVNHIDPFHLTRIEKLIEQMKVLKQGQEDLFNDIRTAKEEEG